MESELQELVETDHIKTDLIKIIEKYHLDENATLPACAIATFMLDSFDSYLKARIAEQERLEEINSELQLIFGEDDDPELFSRELV
jgi:hypothetical protein